MELLRGEQRKFLSQIEARLRAENRKRSGAGAIHARLAVVEHEPKQIVVLAHQSSDNRDNETDSIHHFDAWARPGKRRASAKAARTIQLGCS
jgi:phosphoribosyl 1,2-cyclic phosphodiesterase